MACCGGQDTETSSNKVSSVEEDSEKKKDYGPAKQHDLNFKGPMKDRSCTDIICCAIFLTCITGFLCCSIIGYARGDPIKLVYPTDSFGNICGTGAYSDKKFLFFFDLLRCAQTGAAVVTMGCPTPQICVSECPSTYWTYAQTIFYETAASGQVSAERAKMLCKYSVDPYSAAKTVTELIDDEDCAAYYVKSSPVINRCIPSIFAEITNLAADLVYLDGANNFTVSDDGGGGVTGTALSDGSYYLALFYEAREFVELVYKDVLAAWWMILVGIVVAMAVCMLWIVLMRFLAGPMVWATIIGVFVLVGFATYYSFDTYYDLKKLNATEEYGYSQAFAMNFSYYLNLKKTWLAFGCTSATILALLILIFVFLVKRICIAIELIKEASRYIIPMQLFMLFMLLWGLNFIVALGHMTLAGAFASYYWAWEKPRDIPAFPLAASVYRSLRYHLGSIAFGSFIIAVVQMIRIVLEYIEYKLKDSENRVAKFIIRCLQCCFWCLEKFLKFLNKNAYIMIAIHGKNFCFSAKDAFFLIMRNIVRVVVLDKVTDFLLFLSKLLVTGIVFTMAYIWFKGNITYFDSYVTRPELNYYLTPVIILTLCCYLMACVFFGVYSMAVDTLFLCFLEDLERNDGSATKPYFMSKGLMKVLGKKNEKLKDPQEKVEPKKSSKTAKVAPSDTREKRPLPEPNTKGKWAS
ncbi:hypothetical protein EGW08_008790 [Elysia chlorotica]|uniref:Choline transporter-like protein n=1 Tax=Elysia chlorotica TaxID=188477 RepID=A0A433TPI1_ELYCH|nr:hypothetical protein EGW08_008790 [Elysia chlorotica]